MDEVTLLQLIADEHDPKLRKVLEQYRAAEIELGAAAEGLERMGRHRWSSAAASRARDVAWQATRYMRIENQLRGRPMTPAAVAPIIPLDWESDAPTDPRGYPSHTGLTDLTPAEVINTNEAVLDTDPAPPLNRRRDQLIGWALNIALVLIIGLTLWLMRRYALTVL